MAHWIAYGIPANVTEFAEGEVGVASNKYVGGKSTMNVGNYVGPCTPAGIGFHHYTFLVMATDLEPGAMVLVNEENPESAIFRLKHQVRTWIQNDTDVEWHRTYGAWKALLDANHFAASAPQGADLLPLVASMSPAGCWSLVFTAERQ